ncbi:LysR family transcriptional regulator [Sphingomonas sp. PL-96]|uniref:LysR family transcriptional regulator n=1 Tax=Sphingomonas sp. PL-96 TaxID=2887201 RepID=UPI001E463BE5|nr:LysR family transcriptional regulator [Sphingomonas sp. PL-96]MCC2978314.1 LysR family transcriptional regulator [Sphingomonas sp. PL-96]
MELGVKRFTGRVSDNDLRLLRTFCTVVRHGGFVAAESELQIGLPSISRYIKDLEIRLGMRLCDRGRRGFTLTNEGRQVHDACARLFNNLDEFAQQVRDIHANPAGAVRIGMVDTLISEPHFSLSGAIRDYKATFPNIHFSLATMTTNVIEQEVINGNLDLGIIFERRHMEQLSYHVLFEEFSYLYCSVAHPLWRDHAGRIDDVDLSAYEFAGFPMAHMMEKMGVSGLLHRTATATSMESIAMLIDSDAYLGFLPEQYVQSLHCADRFRVIAPEKFSVGSRISAITRSGLVPPLAGSFIERLLPDRQHHGIPARVSA